MRAVRYSRTAETNFQVLLAQGAAKFGRRVAHDKRRVLIEFVRNFIAAFPHLGLRTRGKSFLYYPIRDTPFTVVYDYDDREVRVLFIVHKSADRRRLRHDDVVW